MAKMDADLKKRIDEVVNGFWGHITPGTPAAEHLEQFKCKLHEAISPTPAQPVTAKSLKD